MAIKRLVRDAQFPCVGKLRKGGEKAKRTVTDKKTGQPKEIETYGADLTYFRFDTDDQRAATCFHAAYGDEPAAINVYLPHQSAAENFSCWQEAYLAGGLTHRCDGETCVIWLENGKYRTDPKPCPGGCKEVGRMRIIIPELQRFAYVTVETHSIHDIIRLQENLQAVEYLRGDLRGIPFVLRRSPVEISTPSGDGKRTRREKWLLSIEVDPAWASLQLESMHRAALTVSGVTVDDSRLLTTSYVEEDEDDEPPMPIVNQTTGEIIGPDTTALDTLGQEIYGAKWPDVRAQNIERITNGAILTQANVKTMLNGLKKLKERNFPIEPITADIMVTSPNAPAEHLEASKPVKLPPTVQEWLSTPKPVDAAYAWSVDNKTCNVTEHAKNALKKVVDEQFNGKFKNSNMSTILTAFYWDRVDKLNRMADEVISLGSSGQTQPDG